MSRDCDEHVMGNINDEEEEQEDVQEDFRCCDTGGGPRVSSHTRRGARQKC
jgi:hypothetical protein